MLTGDKEENPLLNDEFKRDVIDPIEKLKNSGSQKTTAPISSSAPMGQAAENAKQTPAVFKETEINISTELISEWLPSTLKRFKCCDCPRCAAEASAEAFRVIEPVKFTVRSPEDLEKAKELKEEYKRKIMMKLVSIAVARKALPIHNV